MCLKRLFNLNCLFMKLENYLVFLVDKGGLVLFANKRLII